MRKTTTTLITIDIMLYLVYSDIYFLMQIGGYSSLYAAHKAYKIP